MSDYMDSLHVQDLWYNEIIAGRKNVEGRTGGPEKFAAWVGHPVRLTNGTSSAVFTVSAVRHYPNLYEYVKTEGWTRVAPHTGSIVEAVRAYRKITTEELQVIGLDIYSKEVQVFSEERVADRGGICALELTR